MKIAIATVQIPFVSGGAEFLAQNLKKALIEHGHQAEIVTMPFVDSQLHMVENHIIAARMMDLNNSWGGHIDLCIGLKFPAYYIPHENKVIWALHQHRQAYDLFDTEYSNIKNDAIGREVRSIVTNADNAYLKEAKRIYTISQNIVNRMQKFNNIASTTLYHPCPDMEKFYAGEYEDYILMPSRINATKRQKLAIEAMAKTKSDIKLYIVGKADNPVMMDEIRKFIKEHHLEKRIVFMDYVEQEKKLELYANAKAVLFIPVDEDYGYITLEGMSASKAVITAKDSGGPLEFVEDGKSGLVVEPTAEEIARAIDEVAMSKTMATEFGKNAKKHIKEMNISWDYVVKELTK